jgi:hypothetical protein
MPLMTGEQRDGNIHHWCQWCGLRGTTMDKEFIEKTLK